MSNKLTTCSICGDVFEPENTDEEAMDDARQLFGKEYIDNISLAVVCDTCYDLVINKLSINN